jgi:hypothetical protein
LVPHPDICFIYSTISGKSLSRFPARGSKGGDASNFETNEGAFFNDSDVHKVLEGAAYSLADHPDTELDKMVDEVSVWIRQEGKSIRARADDPSWQGRLYRPLDPATLGKSLPPTLAEKSQVTASHVFGRYTPSAANDRDEPENSADVQVERFSWFQHPGTKEWIQYTFPSPQTVSAVEVYWYQHQACETPQSWKLLHKSGDEWNEVPDASAYGTEIDHYSRVTFKPVETTALRIEVQSKPEKWSGILEWKVETVGP